MHPDSPGQPAVPPEQSVVLPVPPVQSGPVPPLNWSHFKPEFAGKLYDDAGAHVLKTYG